jgi:Ribonuclease G/E
MNNVVAFGDVVFKRKRWISLQSIRHIHFRIRPHFSSRPILLSPTSIISHLFHKSRLSLRVYRREHAKPYTQRDTIAYNLKMAEEEADYGLDDEQDEWRRGPVDIVGEANEDVLSLDGHDDEGTSKSSHRGRHAALGREIAKATEGSGLNF